MTIDVLSARRPLNVLLDSATLTCILVRMFKGEKDLSRGVARSRDPVLTRQRLLQAASQEICHSGFRGSDLEGILNRAGVTKGALYHHFENKEALGHAVVDEVLAAGVRDKWLRPLERATNPIDALARIVQSTSTKPEWLRGGCPINNLAQEMSALDEGFRKRLAKLFSGWYDGIAAALREGQKRGLVRNEVDPRERAIFLVAVYEGYLSLAKNSQDARVLRAGKRTLILQLESLRPCPGQNRSYRPMPEELFLQNEHTNRRKAGTKNAHRVHRPHRAEDRLSV
jgi:TetR/AcrR family transcriptional regulator, transcriptional repressor for nem operon